MISWQHNCRYSRVVRVTHFVISSSHMWHMRVFISIIHKWHAYNYEKTYVIMNTHMSLSICDTCVLPYASFTCDTHIIMRRHMLVWTHTCHYLHVTHVCFHMHHSHVTHMWWSKHTCYYEHTHVIIHMWHMWHMWLFISSIHMWHTCDYDNTQVTFHKQHSHVTHMWLRQHTC